VSFRKRLIQERAVMPFDSVLHSGFRRCEEISSSFPQCQVRDLYSSFGSFAAVLDDQQQPCAMARSKYLPLLAGHALEWSCGLWTTCRSGARLLSCGFGLLLQLQDTRS
jgi:hypothetical protein